jgi:hypothetical protein
VALTEAEQSNMPTQMDLKPTSDKKPDKKLSEGETQTTIVDDSHIADGLLAGIVLPAIMPVDQGKSVNTLAPTDAVEEDVLSAFIKPSAGDAKPNQLAKASDNVLQSETTFRLPDQGKQEFNLKYFENAGQSEKPGDSNSSF